MAQARATVWRPARELQISSTATVGFKPLSQYVEQTECSTLCRWSSNPTSFPAGPQGETPFFSERDFVAAVDQLGVFILGCLRAAEEVDFLGVDLAAVAVGAGCVGPLGIVDAAVDSAPSGFYPSPLPYGLRCRRSAAVRCDSPPWQSKAPTP